MAQSTPLLRRALTLTSLGTAFAKVHDNDGCPGCDGQTIAQFADGLDERLRQLQREVMAGTYRPHHLLRIWCHKPDKAPRGLAVPTVRDRVLQTSVAKTLTPIFEAEFEDCSFAYRQGRSVRQAVERISVLQRQGYRWVVDADIEAFFDRIPHVPLMDTVGRIVDDTGIIALLKMWLTVPILDRATLQPVDIGVPQGSPMSPLLANLYLDHLDEALLDQDYALVRYADDFIILTRDRDRAQEALELTQEILRRLHLKINPLKTRVVNFDQGFEFLGWNFVRSLAIPRQRHGAASSRPSTDRYSPADMASTQIQQNPDSSLIGPMQTSLTNALHSAPEWDPRETETVADATPPPELPESTLIDAGEIEFESGDQEEILPAGEETSGQDVTAKQDDSSLEPARINIVPGEAGEIETADRSDPEDDANFPTPGPIQRTLYLVEQGARLAKEGERLVVRKDENTLLELPAVNVDQVMVFGNIALTTPAIQLCMRQRIPVALMSRLGRYYGRIDASNLSSLALLEAQSEAARDMDRTQDIARACVLGKLENSALLLSRYGRRHGTNTVPAAANELRQQAKRLNTTATLDQLRGMEGNGARIYFGAWQHLLDESWGFSGRKRRPPPDPVNVLLSLGYTLLYHCMAGLIQARGLNPHLGFLHAGGNQHLALASDLIEEFRAVVVDAVVLKLTLNESLAPDQFRYNNQGCSLSQDGVRIFIRAFEAKLNSGMKHPLGGARTDLRRIMDGQVLHLTRVLRNAEPIAYRACVFK